MRCAPPTPASTCLSTTTRSCAALRARAYLLCSAHACCFPPARRRRGSSGWQRRRRCLLLAAACRWRRRATPHRKQRQRWRTGGDKATAAWRRGTLCTAGMLRFPYCMACMRALSATVLFKTPTKQNYRPATLYSSVNKNKTKTKTHFAALCRLAARAAYDMDSSSLSPLCLGDSDGVLGRRNAGMCRRRRTGQ